jgi:oxygen-independent coproporphyrinogen-3 oxidase
MATPSLIQRYNTPIPRYTSYPPAPAWMPMGEEVFCTALRARNPVSPLSLYLHIPFCHAICSYCGCSTIPNRRPELEEQYVNALLQEIALVRSAIGHARVNQLHFGGGTPTKLHPSLLKKLIYALKEAFSIDATAEIAIEVDPRTVAGESSSSLHTLKALGFNRISLGIQDMNQKVQNAIGRRQSEEVSTSVYRQCQEIGFESINFDLVYGLPCQTTTSFQETINHVIALHPHRIAIFSFAYLPELKPHQKAISPSLLPSPEEKFQIYYNARESLVHSGYTAIGLDHFAVPEDPLSRSLAQGSLRRTFQGYTVLEGHDVVGLGMTAISDLGTAFFQNAKTLPDYFDAINRGKFPTARGIQLTVDDLYRRLVIEQLMCQGKIQKREFEQFSGESFDVYFHDTLSKLKPLLNDGLVSSSATSIEATPLGQMFLRNIASCFDASLTNPTFSSKAI